MTTHIDILLYDGFDELDAIGPFEVFQNAAVAGGDFETTLVTLEARERVTASHGLRVEPDGVLAEPGTPGSPDILLVPGGGWNDRSPESAWAEAERGAVPDAIAGHHRDGVTLAGVCTGGMLIARAGLLEGRPAITHHGAIEDLRSSGAEVTEARVVDDGDLVTAGGVTSGLDLALHLVEREAGADVAESVARTIEYERRDEVATR